jgi:hypothetical protein
MKDFSSQYLFAVVFIAVGGYQLYKENWLEASLYILAALSFIFNTLAGEKKFQHRKKLLVRITWTLMIITALLFLWVLQFKYL